MTAAARKPQSAVSPARRAMLAKVHLAAKETGLRDEERRDVLERLTGHRSSADCTDQQLDLVLKHFRSLGWKAKSARPAGAAESKAPASKPVRRAAQSGFALKARALWISLYHLGAVRDGSEAALEAFGCRQLKVDRLQWADESAAYRLIEALKAMAQREGWDQNLAGIPQRKQVWWLKARLVRRQLQLLGRSELLVAGKTEAELDTLARELGVEVRAHRALKG